MKKYILLLALALLPSLSRAVLKEDNMDRTIVMLYSDLSELRLNMDAYIVNYDKQRADYISKLNKKVEECQEYALVLYTQQEDYLFGLSQACQRITNAYSAFEEQEYPFKMWCDNFDIEIQRYNKLISLLSRISPDNLSARGKASRSQCILICKTLQLQLEQYRTKLDKDSRQYNQIVENMREFEQYNDARFSKIREKVFLTGSESYFYTLSHFGDRWKEFTNAVYTDFFTGQGASDEWIFRKVELIIIFVLLLLVAWALSFFAVKRVIPRRWLNKTGENKDQFHIATLTTILFALLMAFVTSFVLNRYYFIMATRLAIEFTLLVSVVLLSLTLRLKEDALRPGLRLYLPPLFLSAILIFYRVALVSNVIVAFTLPIFLVLFGVIHLFVLLRYWKGASQTDAFLSCFTLVLTFGGAILSWSGYRFLSLYLIIFWMILQSGIQLIICLRHLFGLTVIHSEGEVKSFKEIWFDSLMDKLIIPLLSILIFLGSIIWTAHIFSMSSWIKQVLGTYFVNIPNVVTISVYSLLWVLALGFIFNYLIYIIKAIVQSIYKEKSRYGIIKVCKTIGTIIIWCLYVCISILILGINEGGLLAAVGGASMGIGFSLKDTLDNLFCGMSLMFGRVHIGDMVECDGIRGKVMDVGIRSTVIETTDGSIVAFLNNQLFTKNFKNLTKNHSFEQVVIPVDVEFGADIDKVREAILKRLVSLSGLSNNREAEVLLEKIGTHSIDLNVVVWVPVTQRVATLSKYREAIYQVIEEEKVSVKEKLLKEIVE